MGREEARAKAWNTFRESIIQHAKENPDFSLRDFIVQRVDASYVSWRQARDCEWKRDFITARGFYLKAIESLEQAEKIVMSPLAAQYVEMLKNEYYHFVVHRDPYYRNIIKYLLPVIEKEPGILQTETYKRFNHDKSELMYALYFAEKEGLIRREKKGRSYQLFFIHNKAIDEPLLNIQWDEIDFQNKAAQEEQAKRQTEEKKATKTGCLVVLAVIIAIILCIFTGPIGIFITLVGLLVLSITMIKKQKKVRSTEVQPIKNDD